MIETKNIKSKNDFVIFLNEFYTDFKKNGSNWENNNLDSFLNTLIAYTKDIDGLYENMNESELIGKASWRTFADILIGTSIYE